MGTPKIAILYSTVDGHTLKICERLISLLNESGLKTKMFEISDFDGQLGSYDLLLIGASIRYGKHNKKVVEFINRHHEEMKQTRTAFFSVNLVARKPEKNTASTNPYVTKFFETVEWKPDVVGVFAGVLDYPSYGFFDKLMIKLIMKITGGPTNGDGPIEYTNWDRVSNFAKEIEGVLANQRVLI